MTTFKCQECGRKFRIVKGAERAANNGCPGCGGVDIDLDTDPAATPRPAARCRCRPPKRHPDCQYCDYRYGGEVVCGVCREAGIDGRLIPGTGRVVCSRHKAGKGGAQ